MVNLDAAETPLFISTIDGLRSEPTAYFIAEEKHFRMLPKDVADKMMVRVRGRLGHDPVVVFTHRGN
jgi:hypothetical protein